MHTDENGKITLLEGHALVFLPGAAKAVLVKIDSFSGGNRDWGRPELSVSGTVISS